MDLTTGILAFSGVLLALLAKARGRPAIPTVQVSLFETALTLLAYHLTNYANGDFQPRRAGSGVGHLSPYTAFMCPDGYVLAGATNDEVWRRMAAVLGHPEWGTDARFASNAARVTNRKELIDPALLRPGRLEVHLEIRPPDRRGREEVLEILLRPMAAAGHLCPADALDDWVSTIARRTSGWTGADLTGLVRSAASFAILRQQAYRDAARARGGVSDLGEGSLSGSSVVLLWKDFEKAFKEVNKPRNSRLLAVKEM
eukprot:gene44190-58942_t